MDIQIKLHTLIVGVGPKQCGKTFFFKQKFLPIITNKLTENNKLFHPNIKFISSEEIRRWLLNDTENTYHKDSEIMNNVSESCFNILSVHVDESLRTGAHFVVVDTTGMNDNFRNDMKNIAVKHNYNILYFVFDYKNRSDYYENTTDKFNMSKNIDRFKKMLNEFDKSNSIKIKYLLKHGVNPNILITDFDIYLTKFLPSKNQFMVLVHPTKHNIDTIINKFKHKTNCDIILISDEFNINNVNQINLLEEFINKNQASIHFLNKENDICIYNPKENDDGIPITVSYINSSKEQGSYYIIGNKINKITKIFFNKESPKQMEDNNNNINKNIPIESNLFDNLFDNLDETKKNRIRNIIDNKINFISTTVCPVDKNIYQHKNNTIFELENGEMGIKYYYDIFMKTGHPKSLSIQVKYMGSRLQFYYYVNDPNKSFGVTRQGFVSKISKLEILYIHNKLSSNNKIQKFIMEKNIKIIIFDGELMPWSVLGSELIKNEFMSVYHAAGDEIDYLMKSGYKKSMDKLMEEYNESDYKKDVNLLQKNKLSEKYINHQTYKSIMSHHKKYIDIKYISQMITTYREQMDIFGAKGSMDYKPFTILKYITNDANEYIMAINNLDESNNLFDKSMTNSDIFNMITENESDNISIEFTKNNLNICIDIFNGFYNNVTINRKLEGVIIKPDFINPINAPYLKARGKHYLHIIYGFDYLVPYKYEKLCEKKSINKKLQLSISEFKSSLKILQTSLHDINYGNNYVKLLCDFLFLEENELELDKAL
ncbi:MAG: metallophosphoesterase [Terrestrivirus sp.]|uniref:Metallophosphoesterase n=1 Tax=Terrestrivirus sp. TaxID=2487775 RepID=A0A3G4ZLK8_9VIRU|nr:MAG: metallophosphoesterase [Terrestrivirus sp.]